MRLLTLLTLGFLALWVARVPAQDGPPAAPGQSAEGQAAEGQAADGQAADGQATDGPGAARDPDEPVAVAEEGAAAARDRATDQDFVPSEETPPDEQVIFPVDI